MSRISSRLDLYPSMASDVVCAQNTALPYGFSYVALPSSYLPASRPVDLPLSPGTVQMLNVAQLPQVATAAATGTADVAYWIPNGYLPLASTTSIGNSSTVMPIYNVMTREPMVSQYGPDQVLQTTVPSQICNPLIASTNMEVVWHQNFDRLFHNFLWFQHKWYLAPTEDRPQDIENYFVFNDSAKVRFLCSRCRNAWTSMKGRVIFWYRFYSELNQGMVLFKLFGQKCDKCKPETFEHSMWYPEEVVKVITNVFHSVNQRIYGQEAWPIYLERRPGKPRTQHNSTLCQACADHMCIEACRASKK